MKFIKVFLYCLLGFTLAFLLIFFIIYKEYKSYRDIQVITTNVGIGDLNNNELPTLDTLSLSFPQYSDNKIPRCSGSNHIIVKVEAVNPVDEDGMVSRLVFYYYNVDDPSRIMEYQETSVISPYSYFVLPENAGEYRFGVLLYDNNGGISDSEDIIGKGPSTYVSSCDNPEAPTITLISSAKEVEVGDSITYSIVSKVVSKDEGVDFEKNRLFYYDFTGDGEWDLITGKNSASYIFNDMDDESIIPMAAVKYGSYFVKGEGWRIFVNGGRTEEDKHNERIMEISGMNEYEKSRDEILAILSFSQLEPDIRQLFNEFEENLPGLDPEGKAKALQMIWDKIDADSKKGSSITIDGMNAVVNPQFCNIFTYYDILSYTNTAQCTSDNIAVSKNFADSIRQK